MRSRWRMAVPWLALIAVGVAAALLRYGVIEPSTMVQLCGGAGHPWWCAWRHTLALGFLHNVYGIAALLTAALALFSRRLAVSWLAAALGLLALELYCFQSGALALLIGCLRLLRVQASRSPVAQDRPRQSDVQAQP